MTRETKFEQAVTKFYELTKKIKEGDTSLIETRRILKATIGIYYGDLLDEWKANGKKFKTKEEIKDIAIQNNIEKGILLARYWYESWVRECKYNEMVKNGELGCGKLTYELPYNSYYEPDECVMPKDNIEAVPAMSNYRYNRSWDAWTG